MTDAHYYVTVRRRKVKDLGDRVAVAVLNAAGGIIARGEGKTLPLAIISAETRLDTLRKDKILEIERQNREALKALAEIDLLDTVGPTRINQQERQS